MSATPQTRSGRPSRHGLSGALWMTYAYGGGMAVQGVYFLVLARTLGASQLGAFAGALAIVNILAPFAGWGRGNLLVMKTARAPGEFGRELGTALVTIAMTGGTMALVLGGVSLVAFGGSSLGSCLLILAGSELVATRISDLSAQCFQAHDDLRRAAHVTFAQSSVRLALVGVFALAAPSHTAANWSAFYAVASVTLAAISLTLATRRFGRPRFTRLRRLPDAREGLAFSLGSASKTIYADIDKSMLVRMVSEASAGIYTAGYRLVSFAFAPIQALVFSNGTRFYREGLEGPAHMLGVVRRLAPLVWSVAAAAGLALWLAAPLAPDLLGSSFADTAGVVRWLAVMPLIQGTHYLIGDVLMGLGRQGVRSTLQLATAGANVALNIVLIPAHGWRGAALASILCEGALALAVAGVLLSLSRAQRRRVEPVAVGS